MIIALGKVAVTTPGTPVNVLTTLNRQDVPSAVKAVIVQAVGANTGAIYIGSSAQGFSKSTLAGVYQVLPTPTANSLPSFSANHDMAGTGIQINDLMLDADIAGNGAIVTILT